MPALTADLLRGDLLKEKPTGAYLSSDTYHLYQQKAIKEMGLEDHSNLKHPYVFQCIAPNGNFEPFTLVGTNQLFSFIIFPFSYSEKATFSRGIICRGRTTSKNIL